MSKGALEVFIAVFATICGGMSFVNLTLVRQRGISAYMMSMAFLVLGFTSIIFGNDGFSPLVAGGGLVVFFLLASDFVIRASSTSRRRNQ